ncbi:MAG: hypothetical protein GY705_23795, partial [Bacteroidetes bacterium]|nr:hypothetical protein [Bacteroidota bacterium]
MRKRTDLVIKPADKGSGTCVLTNEQYLTEVKSQLNNSLHYEKLDKDISPQIALEIKELVNKYVQKGLLTDEVAKIIIPEEYRAAKFYLLPKIHKNLEQPPGRPIMSANGHPSERLSELVDLHLNRYVQTIPSYIKDTNHLLSILKEIKLPENALLVSFDVSALYTNIPHKEGAEAIKSFMSDVTNPQLGEMLSDLTTKVLESNVFTFDDEYYLQKFGTAMGSRMAPNFANIFMHIFESTHLKNAPIQPLIWKRYIDDILAIFTCSKQELNTFLNWLNNLHPTIKFTMETGENGLAFLDTFIKIQDGNFTI